jgi:cytochrome P450
VCKEYIACRGRQPSSLVDGHKKRNITPPLGDQTKIEVMLIMFAGTDTSETTLKYLFFELARHRAWYACL